MGKDGRRGRQRKRVGRKGEGTSEGDKVKERGQKEIRPNEGKAKRVRQTERRREEGEDRR